MGELTRGGDVDFSSRFSVHVANKSLKVLNPS